MQDSQSEPGAWADAIAHSYCLRVEWFDLGGNVMTRPTLAEHETRLALLEQKENK